MAFPRTTGGSLEDLPTYVRRAHGRDITWRDDASCHRSRWTVNHNKMTWLVSSGETQNIDGRRYIGSDLEPEALRTCQDCPVQWHCAIWAIEVGEQQGTWAIPQRQLRWLNKQEDAIIIIDNARVNEISVQDAVALVRDIRDGARV